MRYGRLASEGHRIVDHVFTLRTLVSQAKRAEKKLFTCFVDLRKAFDSIPRHQTWQVLAGLELTGPLLQCLQSMYAHDSACVLTRDGCTDFFPCTTGVKQGCPASPLFFGLYLDALEAFLTGQGPDLHGDPDGPSLGGQAVMLLLFADDLVLTSQSERCLQSQLNALHAFCENRGLKVNLAKTKVVVFNQRTYKANLVCLPGDPWSKLTGTSTWVWSCIRMEPSRALRRAQRALFALEARCAEMGITDPRLRCRLYDAVVKPVHSYGCEVWMRLISSSC